jgi:hypothetical protein
MNFNGTHPRIVKCKVEPTDGAAILISPRPSESKSYAYKAVSMYIIIVSAEWP